jgi:type II secretory pathway component PulM
MSNIAKLLKETIERAARKQARAETNALRKASGQHRKIISELSARVKDMEREVAQLHKGIPQPTLSVTRLKRAISGSPPSVCPYYGSGLGYRQKSAVFLSA